MLNSFITYIQIFGIGFSFGIIGPCFLSCAPILITYITGTKKTWPEVFKDILTFLSGRLFAYAVLGILAGLSGVLLRRFTSSNLSYYFQQLAGAVTILFALIILVNRNNTECACTAGRAKLYNFCGIFTFGFLIGVSPCAPLLALLFDIALMSKNAVEGMFYALFFGLGTFVAGLITVGITAGILTRIPAVLIKSEKVHAIFRITCAALLIALGAGLLLKR